MRCCQNYVHPYCFLIAFIINIYRFIAYLFSKWIDIFRNDISESAEAIWHIYSASYHVFSDKSVIETVSIVHLMKLCSDPLYQVYGPILLYASYFYIWHREKQQYFLCSLTNYSVKALRKAPSFASVGDPMLNSPTPLLENLFELTTSIDWIFSLRTQLGEQKQQNPREEL